MDAQVLLDSMKAVLLRVKSKPLERATELFRGLSGRDSFVPRLTLWLEGGRPAFPEPIAVENLDSVHDPGVDVLVTGARSGARIGLQVKSDNDLRPDSFTRDLKAQILDALGVRVDLFVVLFACSPTKKNLAKIRYWQTQYLDRPEILCLPPEKAAGLHEIFNLPIEPIVLSGRTWPDFFRTIGHSRLAAHYLDTWPDLLPDQRFVPPKNYDAIRKSVQDNRLTFLVGSPATGKTFVSLRLLWDAFQEGRPVQWITATNDEPTEGPIPRADAEIDQIEKTALKRRVAGLLRTLGSPVDDLDIVSRILLPNALVYIEDPFGKSEEEYNLSLASYSFFDLQRFVEALEKSSARAGCRMLITSREALFQHWLNDLRNKCRESPSYSVIRLTHNAYYPRPLFNHAVLLGRARGFDQPEEIADVLVDHVESPFELDTLIRSLPPDAVVAEAEDVVVGWEGELRDKIESRITPRDDRDTLVLLLIAASDFQYNRLVSPLEMYSKLHSSLCFDGEPQVVFEAILKRLSPFLGPDYRGHAGSLPFSPGHTIVRESIHDQLIKTGSRPLIRRISRTLVDIPPRTRRPRNPGGGLRLSDLMSPWNDSLLVALYLVSIGAALEGADESHALERLIFDLAGISGSGYRSIMVVWQELPNQFRKRILDGLRRASQEDTDGLRQAAAVLPHTKIDPPDAWSILELLLESPGRGDQKTLYEESPWDYLFQHLDEIPLGLSDKLDDWAREDPASFVYTMDEKLVQNWSRVPILWREGLFHPDCLSRSKVWDRLVRTIVRHWGKASRSVREWFDLVARSQASSVRALVGSQALFYAERYPDLEEYALEASRDPDLEVRFETLRWGRGDEAHHRIAEALLDGATPGFAADMMLGLFEKELRDKVAPWEKDILLRCERIGGVASKAAITSAIFAGEKRAHELGYRLTDSPFEEPEIVRAAWLWSHLNSNRLKPPLTDDDLRRLLLDFKEPLIRAWCLALASQQATELPEGFQQLLNGLAENSEADAEAIREGAEIRQSKNSLAFSISGLVD
jgi:hypothetical protein